MRTPMRTEKRYLRYSFIPITITLALLLTTVSPFLIDIKAEGNEGGAEDMKGKSREPKKWTFMVYLAADNNLESYGHEDLDEMKAVGSDSNINIVVLWDGRGSGDGALYYVKNNGVDTLTLSDAGIADEPDMADPGTLDSFLQWTVTNYPAEHYLLSIWNHGSGIFRRGGEEGVRGFCSDENGGGEIELWQLNGVLEKANKTAGQKIDIVGFDVCLLGYMETHYQLAPFVDYGIASEANEPGDGWDYETPLAKLANDPNMSPAGLASEIVKAYLNDYTSYVTQAAVDLGRLTENLIPYFNTFSTHLINYMYYYQDQIMAARNASADFQNGKARDLYDFTKNIQQNSALPGTLRGMAADLMSEFSNTVIEAGQKSYPGANGMTVYFPTSGPSSKYLSKIDMATTQWDEFLAEYNDPREHFNMTLELFDEDGDGHDDDILISVRNYIGDQAEGARVWIDNKEIGSTNRTGQLHFYNATKGPHRVRALVNGFEIIDDFFVKNRPPVARALVPAPVDAGAPVRFNGTVSTDPDGDPLSYVWNFGDGGGSALPDPEYIYENDGIFNVSLTVVDTDSIESPPFEFDMKVNNLEPKADIRGDTKCREDQNVTFDASGSWDTPRDKESLRYRWELGDGNVIPWSGSPTLNHSYSNNGIPTS